MKLRSHSKIAAVAACFALFACFPAPDPINAATGTWKAVRIQNSARHISNIEYSIHGDMIRKASDGRSFEAELDGDPVPLSGASAGTTVAVQKVPAIAFIEVVKRDGKVIGVTTVSVVDRQLATIVDNNLHGSADVTVAVPADRPHD